MVFKPLAGTQQTGEGEGGKKKKKKGKPGSTIPEARCPVHAHNTHTYRSNTEGITALQQRAGPLTQQEPRGSGQLAPVAPGPGAGSPRRSPPRGPGVGIPLRHPARPYRRLEEVGQARA